jgi:hypothetical protein
MQWLVKRKTGGYSLPVLKDANRYEQKHFMVIIGRINFLPKL